MSLPSQRVVPPLEMAPAVPALSDTALGPPVPASATCANCLAPCATRFCGECGAPRLDTRPVTARRFVGELVNEVTSMDSLTMRSLHSLFTRPGELTRDYLAGRTRWYLSPVRVYLLMFAVFLCGEALLPNTDGMFRSMQESMTTIEVQRQHAVRVAVAAQHTPPTTRQRLMLTMDPAANAATAVRTARFMAESRWIQLLNAITWGALLALLYRGRQRSVAEHVVFALHLLAFNLLLVLGASALRSTLDVVPGAVPDWIVWLQWLGIGGYFFVAARRLYAESRARTGVKSVLFVAGAQLSMIVISSVALISVGFRDGRALARRAHLSAAQAPAQAPVHAPAPQ